MSEPLRPFDPSRIAGFRLLRRLGAGGMGVVYLGRTDSGRLAAVKVIQAESAADDGFRARFARETELARRVESPWVVPVLGADAEAATPWLATSFVPGPSLSEAVAAHGPLPVRSARALGGMLAAALADVHAAGLVHRDVKPANVLLAVDGPRLIDFGIARAADDTVLTASGLVVGTPGFLSPEQARGDEATPASDVFALGCFLAYAMSGRPPFGTGEPDALLYRTVHDEPDLDGVEDESRDLVAGCLAKDPDGRPTAREVAGRLAEDVPDGAGWLPDTVARMVAVRSAESLALPGIEPTVVDEAKDDGEAATEDGPENSAPSPTRRRLLLGGGALLLSAGGATAALLATRDGDGGDGGSGPQRPSYVLGVHSTSDDAAAPLSGPSERAARLAVAEHNADPERAYDLEVRVRRDRGDAVSARKAAGAFTADRNVVAVLGPLTEIPMRAAAPVYGQAGLTHVSSTTGHQDFFLHSPDSSFQSGTAHSALGSWIALHALVTGQAGRIGVVIDRAGGTTIQDQGTLLINQWREVLGTEALPKVVAEESDDAQEAIRSLLASDVAAFAYFGPLDGTVRAARQLVSAGFDGPRWMAHQHYGSLFPQETGPAGEGWYVVTSAVDASVLTSKRAVAFTRAWQRRYSGPPEPHAAEAYDSVRMLLTEFARTASAAKGRRPARAALGERLTKVAYQGIARKYAFGAYHHYDSSGSGWTDGTFVHQVRDGRFRQLGSLSDLEQSSAAG